MHLHLSQFLLPLFTCVERCVRRVRRRSRSRVMWSLVEDSCSTVLQMSFTAALLANRWPTLNCRIASIAERSALRSMTDAGKDKSCTAEQSNGYMTLVSHPATRNVAQKKTPPAVAQERGILYFLLHLGKILAMHVRGVCTDQ